MQILGLNKTTLLDYPEHVAATVFTGGCNFCCPFCHNGDLVLHAGTMPPLGEEEIFAFLKKRVNILQGVCITGGEPTLQPDLPEFIRKIKAMGYLVKLDTNGARPEVLAALLRENLLDYVAMDIKNCPEKYGETIGKADAADIVGAVGESIRLLLEGGISHEFRTTVVKELHGKDDILKAAQWIAGADAYFLQVYRDNEHVIRKGFSAYDGAGMEELLTAARKFVSNTQIRGME